tara:strand:- start:911 stop:1333 length:423 start_codon:yes stop_codon:yes gene_type:complete
MMGINVRTMEDCDFANLIVKGFKTYETRKNRSLDPYINKRVGVVRTESGTQATLVGFVDIGQPEFVDREQFDLLRDEHLVPYGHSFECADMGRAYLYPLTNPEQCKPRYVHTTGIVARNIVELVPMEENNADDTTYSIRQ